MFTITFLCTFILLSVSIWNMETSRLFFFMVGSGDGEGRMPKQMLGLLEL